MRTPTVHEITEAEYLRMRREITAREHDTKRARVTRAVLAGRDTFRDVYPQRQRR